MNRAEMKRKQKEEETARKNLIAHSKELAFQDIRCHWLLYE